MRIRRRSIWLILGLIALSFPTAVSTAEQPDSAEMSARVDQLLRESWTKTKIKPADRSSDSEFVRRVYLDLTGVIPTAGECRDFLEDASPTKRTELIDQLLASPKHATHLATTWRNMMLPSDFDFATLQNAAGLQDWLRKQFVNNLRYDRVVADLLAATGNRETGPALYFQALELKPEKLAANTSRTFLGVQLECAECHDHPFDRWTQEDFWGYAAFFAQLQGGDMQQVGPNADFELVDLDSGDVTIPETDTVVPPAYPGSDKAVTFRGTRREQLAVWMASRGNPFLPRAAVNRVWAHLFGIGLVNPIDDMREDNPPAHPELLDELTNYFITSGYDLRKLYRSLANTSAYQATSRSPGSDMARESFARQQVKAMTSEQLYDSLDNMLSIADENPPFAPNDNPLFNFRRLMFVSRMKTVSQDATEYQPGLQQALTMMNGELIADATGLESSRLLKSLEAPFLSNEQRIESLFLATLSRFPKEAELQTCLKYVNASTNAADQKKVRSDILWALVNSSEFTLIK